ncbi:MAG: type II toxin-antitoxin system death-on-curing family toxin [Pseudomonadota bacterium]
MTPVWLRKEAIIILHDESLADHGGLPGFRDKNLLDSALARPENLFHYGEPELADLAAEYAFGIVRNHPFLDGNKRAGFLSAATFLLINGQMLRASEADATNMTLALAASDIDAEAYAAWLKENLEPVS